MVSFYKIALGVIIAIILCLILSKQGKDYAMLLSVFVCSAILTVLAAYLQPIISFFTRVRVLGQLNADAVQILLKSVGICLVTELVSLICLDGGNQAMSKSLKMLGTSVVVWISLPLFEQLLDLIENILGEI